jgi:hypothetical protein
MTSDTEWVRSTGLVTMTVALGTDFTESPTVRQSLTRAHVIDGHRTCHHGHDPAPGSPQASSGGDSPLAALVVSAGLLGVGRCRL